MRLWMTVLLVGICCIPAPAQRPDRGREARDLDGPPAPTDARRRPPGPGERGPRRPDADNPFPGDVPPDVIDTVREMNRRVRSLGPWDKQYGVIRQATDSIWRQQGWNDEADRFARQLMLDVSKRPPWDAVGRFNAFMEALKRRYNLTDQQAIRLRITLFRESVAFFAKHGKEAMAAGRDLLEVLGRAAFVLVWAMRTELLERTDGARGFRHVLLDAGLAGENAYLSAVARNLGVCGVGAYYDDAVNDLIGGQERGHRVIYLMGVGHRN